LETGAGERMKKIDVEIWKRLLDAKDGLIYAESLCCSLGMTRRQLLSRVSGLNQPLVKRAGDAKEVYFIIGGDMAQRAEATVDVLSTFFKCSPDRIRSVADCISVAGYMTLDEISLLTSVPVREVAYILYVMPNITMRKGSKKNHYVRCEDVSVDLGIANDRAQLAQ